MMIWNVWHGCRKYSPGCQHCYVYRRDESVGRDASQVVRTASFDLARRIGKDGTFQMPLGEEVMVCMTSDFFLEEADAWRPEVWEMIRNRPDCHFTIITKRITRAAECLPPDWGRDYAHVTLCCTVENQKVCEERLPVFLSLPLYDRMVICEPLLGPVDLTPFLDGRIRKVTAGGESGKDARICRYEWILSLRQQCMEHQTAFHFKQTGARFEKDGRVYLIDRKDQQKQAQKACIDYPEN